MNKKIIIKIILFSLLFANVLFVEQNTNVNISLSDIKIMALAEAPEGWPSERYCDEIWVITYSGNQTSYVIDCSFGGSYKCPFCLW